MRNKPIIARIPITLIFLCVPLLAPAATPSNPACAAFKAHLQAKLPTLDYFTFDVTPNQGWRRGDVHHCYAEEAALIDRYLALHPKLNPTLKMVLNFHSGQSLALAGRVRPAIAHFQQGSFNPPRNLNNRMWNVYVQGTIAFLRHDRATLAAADHTLHAHSATNPQAAGNVHVMDALLRHFGASYATAYLSDDP